MEIGIPKEVKNGENRVAIAPSGVHEFIRLGHQVFIERDAGLGAGISDEQFATAGAVIVPSAPDAWCRELVLKVKEPTQAEYAYFHEKLMLFTYLHLAAEPVLTEALVREKVTAIAYETVQLASGGLPLLTPMSDIAGRMAAQLGAHFLEKPQGGKGLLLGGVPGVRKGKVVIIGGGVVGTGAAQIALGLGAEVTILDTDMNRLRYLDERFSGRLRTLASGVRQVADSVTDADLVIGAVLIPGARAPKLVGEEVVRAMGNGSVIVDVAIDQGGIFETIDQITTHDDPVFERHGVLHYAVANMPGSVPRTATAALTNATLPYALELATKGARAALLGNAALGLGVNTMSGRITYEAVANAHGLSYTALGQCLESVSA
ncbi:alanine dehydrogenase [Paenibacillus sp. 2TAB19]|uniref:alanine dehydrogenase n=1 Tax=Paenibacillus sp. 2TAB19 TaxID=3233003 RepID=UPI003F9791E5